MIEAVIHGIKFECDDQENLKVTNTTSELLGISFENNDTKFNEYVNFNFGIGVWCATNPKSWVGKDCSIINIKISSSSQFYVVKYDRVNKKFFDNSDKFYTLDNYKEVKKKISLLIPAYNTQDVIDETLDPFIHLSENLLYLDLEIIVLIDGCTKVLQHISNKVYPDCVKIYYSQENLGLSVTKNTLITLSSNEKNIIFDSDDIPLKDLVNNVFNELDNYDFVYYKHYEFTDGKDYTNKKNLKKVDKELGGTFGFLKESFLECNGFFPWRVQSDDEFSWRLKLNNAKVSVIEEPQYCYRKREDSLSRNPKTKKGTVIRTAYVELINNKINDRNFNNPEIFKYNKNVLRLQ